jgi:Glycosyl transferases group 1
VNVFLWHVHGSWTTAFVQGGHDYFVPVLPGRGPNGRGRAETWQWPDSVVEVTPAEARTRDMDLLILQRPEEFRFAERWLGRRPGRDIPTIYLEHNAPQGRINDMRHVASEWKGVTVVHVTHFNDLFWDTGRAATRVIEHGIVDPGYRYTGELARTAVVINEPVRRGRVTGTDLLAAFERAAPVDLFGMKAGALGGIENLPQDALHTEMARRRVYVHPIRWTSLGLSLIEAMHLGMPVVALATTEVPNALPPEGFASTNIEVLVEQVRHLITEPEEATRRGKHARAWALERYGLGRFLGEWDRTMEEVCA